MKPGSANVTAYVPDASAIVNVPAPSVTAVAAGSPAASRASAVTPGSTRPVVSVTVPETAASWAAAGMRVASIPSINQIHAALPFGRCIARLLSR